MTRFWQFLAQFVAVMKGADHWVAQLRAGARMMLAAALLSPLALAAPNWVASADAQTANIPPQTSARPSSGPSWTVLPNNGLNGDVSAFAVCGGQLYVGGSFQQTGDGLVTNLNNIARLNTTTNTWSALMHMGLNANVFALACLGNDLYVGGYFNQTFDGALTNLHKIAKYNTATDTWSALAHDGLEFGASDRVSALAFSGTDLYVGGYFVQTADGLVTNLNYIAKFSTSGNAWSALAHHGLNFGVNALAVSGSDLYVGGFFGETADGGLLDLDNIAKYNISGNTWSGMPNTGLNNDVTSLALNGGDLYVGGSFIKTDDNAVTNLNKIARFSTTSNTWSAVANHGLNGDVSSLAFLGGDLYVGGLNFSRTADSTVTNLNNIAKLSTTSNTWSALPDAGLNNQVHALIFIGGNLFVGGLFTHTFNAAPRLAAPQQAVLTGMAQFVAATACNNVTGNVALQLITCGEAGTTMTIAATQAQFAAGDVVVNVTEMVSCSPQTITSVRAATPDGTTPNLSGPIGATSGVFAGPVPLLGASGPLVLKVLCSGSATPVTFPILTIVTVVVPPSGQVGVGSLAGKLANANLTLAEVVLYYKDPTLGDVIWNANAYNQLNPQLTNSAASGQFGWSVPSGQYFIKVSGPCYQSAQSSVVSVPPDITSLNIILHPVASCTTISLPIVVR